MLPLEITLLAGKRKMLENGWLVYLCFEKLLLEVKFLVLIEYLGSENRNLAQFSFLWNWKIILASRCKPSFHLSFTTKKNIVKSIILRIIANQNNKLKTTAKQCCHFWSFATKLVVFRVIWSEDFLFGRSGRFGRF